MCWEEPAILENGGFACVMLFISCFFERSLREMERKNRRLYFLSSCHRVEERILGSDERLKIVLGEAEGSGGVGED
jgi:hypothetical protein